MMKTPDRPAPALKEIFDETRMRHIAEEIMAIYPQFPAHRFLSHVLKDLSGLSLMERLRQATEALHKTLPSGYAEALEILFGLAPRLNSRFVTLVLPDYVALYGLGDLDTSLRALKFFTAYGSSEFAIRHFLRRDFERTLRVMETWSLDENEHVRRLASEGSRPRLPWSFKIDALVRDPSPAGTLLDNLNSDPSPYVRKSVANHLNDISKDNPDWALDRIASWPLDDARTRWIAKHALRSLIKKGDGRALQIVGATDKPRIRVTALQILPAIVLLGGRFTLSLRLESTLAEEQRLVVDYAIRYVRKAGKTTLKVFKLKTLTLPAGSSVSLVKNQIIRDFTTRTHYEGRHEIDILVNGERVGNTAFDLRNA